MKAVMISIRPEWCERIADGDKTDEIRKTAPKLTVPFRCYIYQTNALWSYPILRSLGKLDLFDKLNSGKRKVIGEFVCDRIEPISVDNAIRVSETSRVSLRNMWKYARPKTLFDLKAWHISDLKLYDKPKDISEFHRQGTLNASDWEYQLYNGSGDPARSSYASYLFTQAIRKAPQSWCYVEEI